MKALDFIIKCAAWISALFVHIIRYNRTTAKRAAAVRTVVTGQKASGVKRTPKRITMYKVGRNDKCPCGSGLKYKKCHGL
jgi:uncharacterized protein YecA (UPF0149 family)